MNMLIKLYTIIYRQILTKVAGKPPLVTFVLTFSFLSRMRKDFHSDIYVISSKLVKQLIVRKSTKISHLSFAEIFQRHVPVLEDHSGSFSAP